ncbi:MAG: twin-arginine translocase subunit TatB [Rhizobiales bacterium]|nr:twin-arginine translocase subunit TatB [Hyphomicrobiales bacterium]
MFDFGLGYTELVVIALVAIIVIGPKDLPRVLRGLGRMMNKMRGMAREFQGHMDAAMKEAGLDEVKRDLQSLKNPVSAVKDSVVSELNKQDESFKKYFGTLNDAAKPAPSGASDTTRAIAGTPAPSAEPPAAAAKADGEPADLKQAS